MKLKEFLYHLNKIVKADKKALDMEIVTSSDDEGNSFNKVHYSPAIGKMEDGYFEADEKGNTVCLN